MDLNTYLERLSKAVEEGTSNAVKETASVLEDENKRLSPVDIGTLKNSIYTNLDRPSFLAEVKSSAPYTRYVLYGTGIYNTLGNGRSTGWYYNVLNPSSRYYGWHYTRGQRPNYFPQQAYNNQKNNIDKIIKSEISKAISNM